MPKYLIKPVIFLGETCFGASVSGSLQTEIEFTDKEIDQIRELIIRKGTYDFEELDLESELPDIYLKFFNAYNDAGMRIYMFNSNVEAWFNKDAYDLEYDFEYALNFCKKNFGYTECVFDESDEYESVDEKRQTHFEDWFDDFLRAACYSEELDVFLRKLFPDDGWSEYIYDFEIELPDRLMSDMGL